MEGGRQREIEERVAKRVKYCWEEQNQNDKGDDDEVGIGGIGGWAKWMGKMGISMPSTELGEALVSALFSTHTPSSLWKFLQHALSSPLHLLSPLHVLSLLSSILIPHRRSHPEAFTLFLHLLPRYAFSPLSPPLPSQHHKIIRSVDAALSLSDTYKEVASVLELGHVLVLFFFSLVVGLIDSSFHDWGLLSQSPPPQLPPCAPSIFASRSHDTDMDVDAKDSLINVIQNDPRALLRKNNSFLAIEVLAKLTESRKATLLLRLVHLNMYVYCLCIPSLFILFP